MLSEKRRWILPLAAVLAMTPAFASATDAPLATRDSPVRIAVPSAASLLRFYPAQLASSPRGVVEERDVWLAKVQGLMANAPSLLQQSLLNSRSAQEFSANVALLQQMQDGMVKQRGADLDVAARQSTTEKLGAATNSDLVYTAVSPCRIMDSRFATAPSGVQGPLAGGTLYHVPGFITAGQNWGQYGGTGGSDCGLNSSVGANIRGVAVVITILAPNFDAFLGVASDNDLPTVLSNVALNYTRGQGLSTMYVVPQTASNTIYFAMPPELSANLIFDVVGYFAVSQASALDCTTVESAVSNVAAGTNFVVTAPACPAGYTKTGATFRNTTTFSNAFVINNFFDDGTGFFACQGTNQTAGTVSVKCGQVCCRVQGR